MILPAVAGPDRVSFLFGSHHLAASSDFEELNPGVFLTWDRRLDYSVGVFRNSYGRGAIAALAALPVYERGAFQLDLFAGAAYYPEDGRRFRAHLGDIIPMGGLQMRYGYAFAQIIPSDGRDADAIVSFGVTVPLGAGQ
jgi:hypothetical protein